MIAVTAVIAVMLCVLFFPMADGHEITDGRRAATFTTSDKLQQSDVDRLLPADVQTSFATATLECLTMDPALFDITELKIWDMEIQKSVANKVDDRVTTVLWACQYRTSISFTATVLSDGDAFTDLNKDTAGLGELFNNNRLSVGDIIKIDAKLTLGDTRIEKTAYRSNSENNFFVIDENSEITSYADVDSSTINYSLAGKSEATVTIDATSRQHSVISTLYDLRGVDNDDVRTGTPLFVDPTVLESTYSISLKYNDDKDVSGSYSANADAGKYLSITALAGTYTTVTTVDSDIGPTDVVFYGADERYSLFTDAGDASLKDDSAMRTYLQSIGDTSDSYNEAYGILKDVNGGLKRDSNAVLIGIVGVFLLIAAIGVVYVISNRRGSGE